jgi:hypothetical protein
MAYDFSGASQDISFATAPATAAPLSIACWGNMDAEGNADRTGLIAISDAASNNLFGLYLNRFRLQARTTASGSAASAQTATDIALNAWFHSAAVFDSATSRRAYLNGVASSVNTTNRTPAGIDRGRLGTANLSDYINGRLAEVGIWDAALTAAEIALLAQGFSPALVRPQSLVFYAPLVRDLVEVARGVTLTNNNGATVVDHPRLYT